MNASTIVNGYNVEIRGRADLQACFVTKEDATAYAVSMTAWNGGAYRITRKRIAVQK